MNFFKDVAFKFYGVWDSIQQTLVQGIMIAIFVLSILSIAFIVFIAIRSLQKKQMQNAIYPTILAIILSCILMIPTTLSFNKLIKIGVIKLKKEELSKLYLEIENEQLKNDNLKKEISNNSLQKQVNLLKASQVSAMQFEKIADIALIKTNIKQTKVWSEPISQLYEGKGIFADYYNDNILVVNTYDIDAKFGIDFEKIKIKKTDDGKIQFTGFEPKYVGSPKNIKNSIIKEVRRHDYKGNRLSETRILQDTGYMNQANELENKYDKQYQESLENMENWGFLKDAIVSLGQNFIRMIFEPVYGDNIEFVEEDDGTFVKIKDYIDFEISQYNKQIEETLKPVTIDIVQQEKPNSNFDNQ